MIEKELNAIALGALNKAVGAFKNRVFRDGKAADGSQIGSYSTKPFYKSVKRQGKGFAGREGSQVTNAGLKPRGKAPAGGYVYGPFKNGKPRKSMYFGAGYSEYRATVRRRTAFVDLSLTNQLQADIKVGTRAGYLTAEITTPLSVAKARGNEARFKKGIFEFSAVEAAIVTTAIQKAADKLVRRLLRGK